MYFTTVYLQLIATSLKYDLTILTFCLKCLLTTSLQYRHFQVQNLTSSMSESDLEESDEEQWERAYSKEFKTLKF